jgi:hypothetical protein
MEVRKGQLFRVQGSKPERIIKVLEVEKRHARIRTVTPDGKYTKGRSPVRQVQLNRFGVDAGAGNYSLIGCTE